MKACSMSCDEENSPQDGNIYRVCVDPATNAVIIQCIGINRLDTALEANYVSVDALPKWVQKKLALLMMTSSVPPTHGVECVGRRMENNIYWVQYTGE